MSEFTSFAFVPTNGEQGPSPQMMHNIIYVPKSISQLLITDALSIIPYSDTAAPPTGKDLLGTSFYLKKKKIALAIDKQMQLLFLDYGAVNHVIKKYQKYLSPEVLEKMGFEWFCRYMLRAGYRIASIGVDQKAQSLVVYETFKINPVRRLIINLRGR